jgi:hypothetical protein
MLSMANDRPEPTVEGGAAEGATPACVALVPMADPTVWCHVPSYRLSRPNSLFLTHLIATAEQAPQTRSLRRASVAEAQIAYRTARPAKVQRAGIRQIV